MRFLRIRTKGTSVYYVDLEEKKFMRVSGDKALSPTYSMDQEWMHYHNEPEIALGHGVLFLPTDEPGTLWQKTSAVMEVNEITETEVPKF